MKKISRFAAYYKPHIKIFLLDLTAALLLALSELFYPMITRKMINDFIPNHKLRLLLLAACVAVCLYMAKIGLNYFVNYYGHVMGTHMQADMRRDVFSHLQELPISYFENHKSGTLMSRIINDLFDISELAHHGPENLLIAGVLFISSFVLMAQINIWLTLLVFSSIPFFVVYLIRLRGEMSRTSQESKIEIGEVNAVLENAISGVRVTKAYTNKELELQKFDVSNQRFVKAKSGYYKVMGKFQAGTSFMTDFLNLVVMVSGGLFVYYKWIEVGDFAAFILFVNLFIKPIKELVAFVEDYQKGMTGFARMLEILDEPPEKESTKARIVGRCKGDIRFQDVCFSYDEQTQILDHVTLSVRSGQRLALVGPSGAGKTTICSLLPRFYDCQSGTILIDNLDISQMTLESLRENIGIVEQDVFLIAGSIFENIVYGNPKASKEDVIQAAKDANIHEFVQSLPDGYETYVGERGMKLSGGQKQRIAIARAFLKNPPILILDEATSALDTTTELSIQQSLEKLCKDRTTIVVAHRLSTIKNATRIAVISDGIVAEYGNHSDLIQKKGIYYKMYQAQFINL